MDFVCRGGRGCCPAPAPAPGPRAGAGGAARSCPTAAFARGTSGCKSAATASNLISPSLGVFIDETEGRLILREDFRKASPTQSRTARYQKRFNLQQSWVSPVLVNEVLLCHRPAVALR